VKATTSYTKNQHYVWQHYLNAWAETGTFRCYMQKAKKLLPTNPKSIASQTYFYRIHRLNEADKTFLKGIIDRSPNEELRKLNHDFLELNQLRFEMQARLKRANLPEMVKAALERELEIAEKTLGETYHMGVEHRALPILECLRKGDSSFYRSVEQCGEFLYFICNQYFRTAKMRRAIGGLTSVRRA
jgi:hypothetical protein